jgi:hypothetical protein
MSSTVDLRCPRPSCSVGAGGTCVEGFFRAADCPHLAGDRDLVDAAAARARPGDPGGWIELDDGSDLDPEAAERIARAAIARVVVLAGASDSGKTTLLASLYESFQRGPFAGYLFAGSATLLGFERRCHLARIESGRATSETARTLTTGAQRWLHLCVRSPALDGPPRDLLLAEIAGDAFRAAKDSTDECHRLSVSRRADHFVILVDGARLVQRQHRFTAANDAALFLRSCLDADMLSRSSFVDVLMTKWDLVAAAPDAAEIDQITTAFTERTRQHCAARLGRLRFFRVAARPQPAGGVGFAHGLAEIFASWVADSPAFRPAAPIPVRVPENAPEFDRYLWRRIPALRPGGTEGDGTGV